MAGLVEVRERSGSGSGVAAAGRRIRGSGLPFS
jgi:hypothetical protein